MSSKRYTLHLQFIYNLAISPLGATPPLHHATTASLQHPANPPAHLSTDPLHRRSCLIIEPQPWKCYRQAATRLRRQGRPMPAWYDLLAAKPSEEKKMEQWIEACLVKGGGDGGRGAGGAQFTCRELSDGAGAWKRKLLLFERA